jgi:hypothetical protein
MEAVAARGRPAFYVGRIVRQNRWLPIRFDESAAL